MAKVHDRQATFDAFSRRVEAPLALLALVLVPVLLAPVVFELSPPVTRALLFFDYAVWAIFALEYCAKLLLAPRRLLFVKTHLFDLLLVAIPVLRPIRLLRSARMLRLARLGRTASVAARIFRDTRRIARKRGLVYVLLIMTALVFVGAALVLEFERGRGGALSSYGQALWWAAATVTTVGYGDAAPATVAGRGIAVVLMITGVAAFGLVTATLAAYFVESDAEAQPNELATEIRELRREVAALERSIHGLRVRVRDENPRSDIHSS